MTLPDLVHATEVIKSLIEAVDQEINRVSVVQDQVSGLAAKIDFVLQIDCCASEDLSRDVSEKQT